MSFTAISGWPIRSIEPDALPSLRSTAVGCTTTCPKASQSRCGPSTSIGKPSRSFSTYAACYKPTNEYYIENKTELVENDVSRWLLNSFSASNMVHENKSIRNRILVEDVPSALQHLTDILEAMRENRVLEIEYHPFYLEESQHIQLLPYFVKLYERRWYVYGPTQENRRIKVYALDRVQRLSISGRRSACPKVSRPRSIWRLLSASRLSGYSAASYRNKMHRRAAAIPAGIAVALFTGGDRTA